jgi:hypothetical protein
MKWFLIICAASISGVAQAQDSTFAPSRLEFAGVAPSACLIRSPSGQNGVNAVFDPSGGSSGRVRITELVDPSTALPKAASMNLLLPVICTGPHRVTMRTANGGLRRDGAAVQESGGFNSMLPYSMDLAWGRSRSSAGSDSGNSLVLDAAEARAGLLSLQIALRSGNQPLVAGSYTDQIIVEFQAAN